jgi:hypothetical protein
MTKNTFRLLLTVLGLSSIFSLPDLYFLPGFAGEFLYAKILGDEFVPKSCSSVGVPINEPFLVYTNVTLALHSSECLADILRLNYDSSRSPAFLPLPGIEISVNNFGGMSGVCPVYWPFFHQLEKWGYKIGKNAFGTPYDFRYSTAEGLSYVGFINELKTLIEKSFRLRSSKAFLLGHSNGGPTIYTFLDQMPLEWKKKYLAGIITLSGNLLGQMNAYSGFFYSSNQATQSMATSWEATYTSAPWGEYEGLSEVKDFIVTYNGTDQEKHYSPQLTDMQSLFESVNHPDWKEKLTFLYPSMDRTKAPEGVDVYCLYGTEVDTNYAYVFEKSISDSDPLLKISMKGDGNQDIIDNEFCNIWKEDIVNRQGMKFESKGFPGVHHMQMVTDENVLNEVYRIIQLYP